MCGRQQQGLIPTHSVGKVGLCIPSLLSHPQSQETTSVTTIPLQTPAATQGPPYLHPPFSLKALTLRQLRNTCLKLLLHLDKNKQHCNCNLRVTLGLCHAEIWITLWLYFKLLRVLADSQSSTPMAHVLEERADSHRLSSGSICTPRHAHPNTNTNKTYINKALRAVGTSLFRVSFLSAVWIKNPHQKCSHLLESFSV